MGKHYDMFTTAQQKDDSDLVCCAVAEMLDILERTNPKLYMEMVTRLEDVAYNIPYEEAERMVKSMTPRGQHWGYNDVEKLCNSKGITTDIVSCYLVMNMVYNDYYPTAQTYGLQNDVEFFWSLAMDFITDPDGSSHKVAKYFSM